MIELPQTEHELNELIALANKKKEDIADNAIKEFNNLVQEVKERASEIGVSPNALAKLFKVVKFVNPNDETKTWSGLGKPPKWIDQAVSVE
jgi:DNA-binding protein H-NS